MSRKEIESYFSLYRGEKIPLSAFHDSGLRDAIKSQLEKGRFIGQYTLWNDLIVFDRDYERFKNKQRALHVQNSSKA